MSHLRSSLGPAWRPAISLVLLVVFVAEMLPMPVAIRSEMRGGGLSQSAKDATEAFPCRNRPCGCRTAEQCWRSCCCFRNGQKLAWARTHRVAVPAFVVAAAAQERPAPVAKKACCSKSGSEKQTAPTAPREASRTRDRVPFVLAIAAQECHGQSMFWKAVSQVTLPTPPNEFAPDRAASGVVAILSLPREFVALSPPTPPPRTA